MKHIAQHVAHGRGPGGQADGQPWWKSVLVILGLVVFAVTVFRLVMYVGQPAFVGSWSQQFDGAWFCKSKTSPSDPIIGRITSVKLRLDAGPEIGPGSLSLHLAQTAPGEPRQNAPPLEIKIPLKWRRGSGAIWRLSLYLSLDVANATPSPLSPYLADELRFEWSLSDDGASLTLTSYGQKETFQRATQR